jgi:hypothetical protein
MIKHVSLDLDYQKLLSKDHRVVSGTCIGHLKTELTDVYDRFGDLPDTYILENTTIHQLWWEPHELDFADIGRQLGMEVITVSSICQPPGNVIPLHRDTFFQINKRYPDRTELKVRANIHMNDCGLGHFIQYVDEDQGVHTHVGWRAGQGIMWTGDVVHLGANVGMKDKYTLQVSGFLL